MQSVGDDAHIVPNYIPIDTVGDDAHIVPTKYGIIAKNFIKMIPGIDKYVIMPNHIHLIVKKENGTMWASSRFCRMYQTAFVVKVTVKRDVECNSLQYYKTKMLGNRA